jgi:tetratricopeptide (TPR) repeat protein
MHGLLLAITLAGLYWAREQYAQAEPLVQRSLQIYEAALGKDHPHVADSVTGLALLYAEMGRYAQAEPLVQRSLRIYEAKLGKDHPEVARCLNILADLYLDLRQYAQAEPLCQRSLQIRESQLGKDHPNVAESLMTFAELFEATGQPGPAADMADRARRLARRHALRVLPALSEPEQGDFLRHKDKASWHEALSLGLSHPGDAKLAEWSAAWLINARAWSRKPWPRPLCWPATTATRSWGNSAVAYSKRGRSWHSSRCTRRKMASCSSGSAAWTN